MIKTFGAAAAAVVMSAGIMVATSGISQADSGARAATAPPCTQSLTIKDSSASGFTYVLPGRSGSTNCNLADGNQGEGVKALQRTLNTCYGRNLTVDGDFGSATKAAVRYAQGQSGASVDGSYGPNTRDHISHREYFNGSFAGCFEL
jgi:peptidoglycan hydrolase-like protein with peptidoglycan-binding domain